MRTKLTDSRTMQRCEADSLNVYFRPVQLVSSLYAHNNTLGKHQMPTITPVKLGSECRQHLATLPIF